jgi:hypothetical protein
MARLAEIPQASSRFSAGSGYYTGTSSYVTYKKISLEEALRLVAEGSMEGSSFFTQAPKELRVALDQTGTELFRSPFNNLSKNRQKEICRQILPLLTASPEQALLLVAKGKILGHLLYDLSSVELREMLDQSSKATFQTGFKLLSKKRQGKVCKQILFQPLSLAQALRLVTEGHMSGKSLYNQIPKQFCEVLDQISGVAFHTSFSDLSKERQEEVCRMLLGVIPEEKPGFWRRLLSRIGLAI